MAKFPVNTGDNESAVADALNYLLSGPSGLGQNFQGFSSIVNQDVDPPLNETAYLTGNYRAPFTQTTPAKTYVAPIALGTSEYLDARTIKFTFASTQASPPFALGNPLEVVGVTPSGPYDGVQRPTGVIECTTTYVICRINGDGTVYGPGTGGTISYNAFGGLAFVSTDCNAKVTVTGGTDRVFVSGQLNNILTVEATQTSTLAYTVMINRRVAIPNNDPTNPEFVFPFDSTIATKTYYTTVDPTSNRVQNISVTSGTSHVPRSTFPRFYDVQPQVLTGSGNLLTLNIEIRPNLSQSTTGLTSGGPYFTPGPATLYRTEPWNFKNITSCIGTGSVCTVLLTNSAPTFTVGQSVTINGTSSPSFDGTYLITAATPTSIQFASAVAGTATVTGATANAAFYNTVVTVVDPGNGFQAGDTVLVKGSDIGGADGTNDMVLTIDGVTSGTTTLPPGGLSNWYFPAEIETIFTNVIDKPPIGYYWYLIELEVATMDGDAVVTQSQFTNRSLSVQVVKQ